jgi:hypothetical protein
MQEIRRQIGWAKTFGLDLKEISPKEAQDLFPLIDLEGVGTVKDNVTSHFTASSFDIKVTNLNGKNYPTYIRKGNSSEVGSKIVIDNIMYFGK